MRAIVEGYEWVIIDRKQVEDDRIDDLEVVIAGDRVRRQFKSSVDATKPLASADFLGTNSTLRIDRLVQTHTRRVREVQEYRLCATWQPPAPQDSLTSCLVNVRALPTIVGTSPGFYRLRADVIWPEGAQPIWPALLLPATLGEELKREDFLQFCEKFLIELQLPLASTNLRTPGPLEVALLDLLAEHVGVGRYPNQGRMPADVAALAVSLALMRFERARFDPGVRADAS